MPDEAFALTQEPLRMGDMVGEYRIAQRHGAGSYGEVYAAEQPLIGKRVAIKLLHQRYANEPAIVAHFIAEARAVNRIGHEGIIDIFSFGVLQEPQQHYFVKKHLDGMTLQDMLDEQPRLDITTALQLAARVADALDAAHAVQITHRDLKPENIFVTICNDGRLVPNCSTLA